MSTIIFGDDNAYLTKFQYENMDLIDKCIDDIKDKLIIKPEIIVYGKICHQQRDIGFFSNESIGYEYSNQIMESQPLTKSLKKLLKDINKIYNSEFNGILINKYNNGSEYIGPHSDDEKGLDDNVGIIALSYGEERIFRIRNKNNKKIVHEELTTHGSIIQMGGNFQKLYTHEIPIQKKINGIRYSFTFRKHIT